MSTEFPDKTRAIVRAPLHVLGSIPVAALAIVAPDVGEDYIDWRKRAEAEDVEEGRDSVPKAKVDLLTQTAAVKGVLWLHRKVRKLL